MRANNFYTSFVFSLSRLSTTKYSKDAKPWSWFSVWFVLSADFFSEFVLNDWSVVRKMKRIMIGITLKDTIGVTLKFGGRTIYKDYNETDALATNAYRTASRTP